MEQRAFERRLTPCAEFPNDNQDLHHGATWICIETGREPVCGLPRPQALLAPTMETEPRDLEASAGPDSTHEIVSLLTTSGAPMSSHDEIVSLPTTWRAPTAGPDEIVSTLTTSAQPAAGAGAASDASGDPLDDDADLLEDDPEPIEIVDELSFDDALRDLPAMSEAAESVTAPALADEFAKLTSALRDVARSLGADDAAIACLDALFGHTRLDAIAPGERAAEALLAGGVIARTARGIARSGGFTAQVVAWQGILRGESEDFSLADGGALDPLDEWAADVVARVLGPPARVDGIRRELRRRGIAAFGIVAAAA
jgi:hypothetical protein